MSYEIISPENESININNIELNDIEYVTSENENINLNNIELNDIEYLSPENPFDNESEITFGLFSDQNYKNEELSESDNFKNEINSTQEFIESNHQEEDVEFIKMDLDYEISEEFNAVENKIYNGEELEVKIEKSENVFEKPIDNEIEDENILRRQNLKKYNYVFKNKNSSVEELEKVPAYKRMGIEIVDSKNKSDDILSKTILNEDNKLEIPDVNTYLHDNVD